jgi:hypothetical protein
MTLKKFALVFCILCPVIICSCGDDIMVIKYTFDNKSSFTVQITLSASYKYETSSEAESMTSPLSVYGGSEKSVYIQKNNVDFQWTTDYAGNNPKVYCTISGSKATFRDR